MREILFRGKRIDNGKWVKGIPWVFSPPVDKVIIVVGMGLTEENDNMSRYCKTLEVDPSTVGQYTGLTANGKSIFDGDIVKVSSPVGSSYYAKIEYDCGCYWISNPDIQIPDTINKFNMEFVEIIGNIHDNPELLEDRA